MINKKSFKEVSKIIREAGLKVQRIYFKHPTALEVKVRDILRKAKLKFLYQALLYKEFKGRTDYTESFYIASFYFPAKKIAIEIDKSSVVAKKKELEYIASVEGIRTYNIRDISQKIQVLKITEEDLMYPTFTEELLSLLR